MPEFSSILEEAARHEENMDGHRRAEIRALDFDETIIVRPKPIDPRQKGVVKKKSVEKKSAPPQQKKAKPSEKESIKLGAKFRSFAEFEASFNEWKVKNFHPFRTASSETLREPDGSINGKYKYRYLVYHCSHYGAPRVRSRNARKPRSKYLPCGCKAMLRLIYDYNEKKLVIAVLNAEHEGHQVNEEIFEKLNRRNKVKLPQSDGEDDGEGENNEPSFEPTLNFARVMAPQNFLQVLQQHQKLIGLPLEESGQSLHESYCPRMVDESTLNSATLTLRSSYTNSEVTESNETKNLSTLAENPRVQETIRNLLTHLSSFDEKTLNDRLETINTFISN
ncbi:unnamed protein product, partial [Mesorhabditis belari]|uniref:ZSWIM3 N-terminal domain-containing protein n=1 Tax=Mesorhabditis belari TaxID=2138241 RepID=A0AAF3J8S8_9BILA